MRQTRSGTWRFEEPSLEADLTTLAGKPAQERPQTNTSEATGAGEATRFGQGHRRSKGATGSPSRQHSLGLVGGEVRKEALRQRMPRNPSFHCVLPREKREEKSVIYYRVGGVAGETQPRPRDEERGRSRRAALTTKTKGQNAMGYRGSDLYRPGAE